MKIHEYQAKAIFRQFGVVTPKGEVVESPSQARSAAEEMEFPVAVKAQVHVGGRGKAGGVKLARSLDEVEKHASAILGMQIKGVTVRKVLVEQGVDIKQEIYLGLVIDRTRKMPVMMVSAAGGVEIEEVAAKTPEKLLHLPIQKNLGLRDFQAIRAAKFIGLPVASQRQFVQVAQALYKIFVEQDCSLVEINPLVLTGEDKILALDGKINFDDNALYRHPEAEALRDEGEEAPQEVEARRQRLNYVKLDGKIGCIVNGAGLAMATMDLVKHFGGEPANFLDIGGGAKPEQVREALRIITSDPTVNTIFFNIFGGIVRCDRVAEGILQAKDQLNLQIPIVIRLTGTNADVAREMLAGTDLIYVETMSAAAQKAVEISAR